MPQLMKVFVLQVKKQFLTDKSNAEKQINHSALGKKKIMKARDLGGKSARAKALRSVRSGGAGVLAR